jgi:hypothetical protein
MEKIYSIKKSHTRREDTIITGTLPFLINYFSYTLEVGNSWNNKINRYPKTIKSFVKNLQMSFEEQEAACFNRTFISLVK